MAIKHKLTTEAFLSAPRRGPAVPSPSGRIAFHTVSTHTFGEGTKKEVILIDLGSGTQWSISDDDRVHDVNWLPGVSPDTLVWLVSTEIGFTEVRTVVAPAADAEEPPQPVLAGVIPAPAQALKLKDLENGEIAFAVVALADTHGGLYNEKTAPKPASSARIYDDLRVREWDTYRPAQKYAIFYSRLYRDYQWKVGPVQNALRDTDFEAPDNVYQPGDVTDAYDLSANGIVFISKLLRPEDPIQWDCSAVFYVPIESFSHGTTYKPTEIALQGGPFAGACSNVRFSPDGSMIAFLKAPLKCPADTRLHMGHVGSDTAVDVFQAVVGATWHLVPGSFEFAPGGQSLFVAAEDCGREALFELALQHRAEPKQLVGHGSVAAFYPVADQDDGQKNLLLVSGSSFVESSWYELVDRDQVFESRVVSTANRDGARFGLSHKVQVSDLWFEGGGDYVVQAWVVKPSDFDENKKYPVALWIHGGPADSWKDAWHTRWNAALWAEQGYVVVMPNFSGSTGYGVSHAARIYGSWGGFPYEDLVKCMEHLREVPYVDLDRAIAAGGSYGGYMINWINGNRLGRQFKAMVCHDSVYSTETMDLMSDEFTGLADFNGPAFVWSNFEVTHRWNPARPDLLRNWKRAAPTLVIHSDNDYRCPVTDGIAVFKTLQYMGVKSRLLSFPDENHFVQKPENSLEWHRVVFEWINSFSGIEEERQRHASERSSGDDLISL